MKIKDLFLIAGAYIAGNAVASVYNQKKGKDLEKEMNNDKENAIKILGKNILDINKKFFGEVKEVVLEKENIAKDELKLKIEEIISDFKNNSRDLLEDLKKKGPEYISEISENLQKLYEEKKDIIEKYKKELPEIVDSSKNKLLTYFEEIKKEIKK